MAIVYALQKFRVYIYGHKDTLRLILHQHSNAAFETLVVKLFYVLSTQQRCNRTLIVRPNRVGSSTRAFEQRVLVVC